MCPGFTDILKSKITFNKLIYFISWMQENSTVCDWVWSPAVWTQPWRLQFHLDSPQTGCVVKRMDSCSTGTPHLTPCSLTIVCKGASHTSRLNKGINTMCQGWQMIWTCSSGQTMIRTTGPKGPRTRRKESLLQARGLGRVTTRNRSVTVDRQNGVFSCQPGGWGSADLDIFVAYKQNSHRSTESQE